MDSITRSGRTALIAETAASARLVNSLQTARILVFHLISNLRFVKRAVGKTVKTSNSLKKLLSSIEPTEASPSSSPREPTWVVACESSKICWNRILFASCSVLIANLKIPAVSKDICLREREFALS